MPVARPQFNKTLQRVKLQAKLDSVMDFTNQTTNNSARALKLVSTLFDKTIQHLKSDSMEEFFKKQPLVDKDLNFLVTLIEQLKEGLDNLKNESPVLKEFLETINIDEIEKNTSEFIGKLEKLTLTDFNGHSNGNIVKNIGHFKESNGADITDGVSYAHLVIDPLKWEPEFPKIPKDRPLNGAISHINSPSDFYVHPYAGVVEFLLKVQREQANLIQKGITSLPKIVAGMYCAARFHEDFYWYRAKIVDVIHPKGNLDAIEKVRVFYIDYGNISDVTLDNIMPLSVSMSFQKIMAVNCHFVHYDPENGWPEEATKSMKEKVGDGQVQIYFSKSSPRISDVGTFPYYPVDLYTKDNQKVFDALREYTKI